MYSYTQIIRQGLVISSDTQYCILVRTCANFVSLLRLIAIIGPLLLKNITGNDHGLLVPIDGIILAGTILTALPGDILALDIDLGPGKILGTTHINLGTKRDLIGLMDLTDRIDLMVLLLHGMLNRKTDVFMLEICHITQDGGS